MIRENEELVLFINPTLKINVKLKKILEATERKISYRKIPNLYQNEFISNRLSAYINLKNANTYSEFVRESVDAFINLSTYESLDPKFTIYLPSGDQKFKDYVIIYDFIRNILPISHKNYGMRKSLIDNSINVYRNVLFISDYVYEQGINEFGVGNKSRILSCDFLG